jgi:sulfide:quinone oxidoreductase
MAYVAPDVAVANQISPEDMPALAELGIRVIVSNRPDGEEAGQPTAAELEAAAAEVGITFRHVPVTGPTFSPEIVRAIDQILGEREGPALMFCRSGTRSATLWALAEILMHGTDSRDVLDKVSAAGRDPMAAMRLAEAFAPSFQDGA